MPGADVQPGHSKTSACQTKGRCCSSSGGQWQLRYLPPHCRIAAAAIRLTNRIYIVEGGVAITRTFKIFKIEDIEALTSVSAELTGQQVKNSSVPYKVSFVVAKGFSESQPNPVYHAGLLIVGTFKVSDQDFDYLLADRWMDCVRVTFFKHKLAALNRFREIAVCGIPLTDCDETPAFTTRTPAQDLVQYVQEDLDKKMSVTAFKSEKEVANPRITNCIAFAIRGGMLLAGHKHAESFTKTCAHLKTRLQQPRQPPASQPPPRPKQPPWWCAAQGKSAVLPCSGQTLAKLTLPASSGIQQQGESWLIMGHPHSPWW